MQISFGISDLEALAARFPISSCISNPHTWATDFFFFFLNYIDQSLDVKMTNPAMIKEFSC